MNSKFSFWPPFIFFSLLYLISMAFELPSALSAALKVMPIFLLIALAFRAKVKPRYIWPALIFSACGDVLLALPIANSFIYGLGAFLLAQLSYAIGFFQHRAETVSPKAKSRLLFVALISVGLAAIILPRTGELLVPVAVYLAAIVSMACSACLHRSTRATLITGVLLFVLSDSLIAINKFVLPFIGSSLAIMITYYAAQAFIVTAVLMDARTVQSQQL